MIRKIHKFIFLFFVLFIVDDIVVSAREIKNDINFEVTSFEITNSGDIRINGWSFIDHADNYGGINLETYIVAYTGAWNEKKWDLDPSECTFKRSGKTVSCPVWKTDVKSWDHYYVRCVGTGCNSGVKSKAFDRVKNKTIGKYSGSVKDCTSSEGSGLSGSHCVYHDTGFQIKNRINVDSLIDKFGDNSTVKFRIISKVYNRYPSKKVTADSSDLGFLPSVCKTIYGQKCNKEKVTTYESSHKRTSSISVSGSIETIKMRDEYVRITVNGISPNVQFTALSARQFTSAAGNETNGDNKFRTDDDSGNQYHTILDVAEMDNYYEYKGSCEGKNKCGNQFKARRFKLQPSGSKDAYWGFTSWVKTKGILNLKLKKHNDEKITERGHDCEDFYCVGGNCDYTPEQCKVLEPTNITNEINDNKSSTQCSDVVFSSNSSTKNFTSANVYYYRVSKDYITKYFNGLNIAVNYGSIVKTSSDGNWYYFPITFKVNVNFSQTGKFDIVKGVDSVGNGDGVKFYNGIEVEASQYFNYAFNYNVSATWSQKFNSIDKAGTSPYNTYIGQIEVPIVNSADKETVYLGLADKEKIYKLNSNGTFSEVVYNLDLYRSIAQDNVTSVYEPVDNSIFKVTFSDSYDAKSNVKNSNVGTLACISSDSNVVWNEGEVRSANCSYYINQAYYKNNGADYGRYEYDVSKATDVNYTKSLKSFVYHIPFNLKRGDLFTFEVQGNDLSIVHGISFSYDAICSVKALTVGLAKVRYRPIDVSDPFPNEVPDNWNKYIEENGLKRITEKSFDNPNYQTKIFDNSVKEIIDDFNGIYGYYSTFDDVDEPNGHSKIIDSRLFEVIRGKYNSMGLYDPSKDAIVS